jgi:rod shape-determining protein MreD
MTVVRWSLVLFTALLLQASLVSHLVIADARGDVLLLLPVAAGIVGGADRGALVGFATGLAYDTLVLTPFGLTALAFCLTGYAVGALQGGVLRTSRWVPLLGAAWGSAIGIMLFAVVGEMVGQDDLLSTHLVRVVAVVTLVNVVLVLPTLRVVRWAWAPSSSRIMGTAWR